MSNNPAQFDWSNRCRFSFPFRDWESTRRYSRTRVSISLQVCTNQTGRRNYSPLCLTRIDNYDWQIITFVRYGSSLKGSLVGYSVKSICDWDETRSVQKLPTVSNSNHWHFPGLTNGNFIVQNINNKQIYPSKFKVSKFIINLWLFLTFSLNSDFVFLCVLLGGSCT